MSIVDIPSASPGSQLDRLKRAQEVIQQAIGLIPGEHAIMSYARAPVMETPFTDDRDFLDTIISSLKVVEYNGGSDILSAIDYAERLYALKNTQLQIIVLTDGGRGDNDVGNDIKSTISHITFIGIGSDAGGKIPLGYNADGNMRYKYYSGSEVIIRYERSTLIKLSDKFNANFIDMGISRDFPYTIVPELPSKKEYDIILFLATVCLLFGYFFHPYAQKK